MTALRSLSQAPIIQRQKKLAAVISRTFDFLGFSTCNFLAWLVQCFDLRLMDGNRSLTVTGKYELPVGTDLASTRPIQVKSRGRPQLNGNKSRCYLQLMDSYIRLEIFRLVEYFPSKGNCEIFQFHHYSFLRLPLVACLRKPAWSCKGPHQMTWMLTCLS